eukprot:TRINITY_DN4203_c1_g2_i1.p1 TRINITY_DN4203_c1_g2~~TRINITY_DN4203_c1_g2_i1.p1  ORF type:complete len:533 (+),score=125.93 TRINITY_DN4203_c1_g2_i1:164-1600(+)
MEEGRMELEQVEFSIHKVLEESMDVASFGCEKKGLELICEMDPDLQEYVVGDPTRIRQILVNLLGNAVKFSHKGEIVVTAHSEDVVELTSDSEEADHQVSGVSEPNSVKVFFSVKDSGIGIAEESKTRILQPFSQADSSVTRRFGGSGLGLSISKRLAELMGGSMGFESVEGQGSTFFFTIFVKKGKTGSLAVTRSPSLNFQFGKSNIPTVVVVIEPNECARESMRRKLTAWKLDNTSFTSPEEFSQQFNGNFGHVIVLLNGNLGPTSIKDVQRKLGHVRSNIVVVHYSKPPKLGNNVGFLKKPLRNKYLYQKLFDLMSPIKPMPLRTTSEILDDTPTLPKNIKLLVVEDNVINQKVIRQLLISQCGVAAENIELAENGKIAVDLVVTQQRVYSTILMDLMMPEMSGIEATEIIRRSLDSAHQPVIIALTANAFKEDREKCLEAGMNDVVTKPINRRALTQVIAKHLNLNGRSRCFSL